MLKLRLDGVCSSSRSIAAFKGGEKKTLFRESRRNGEEENKTGPQRQEKKMNQSINM